MIIFLDTLCSFHLQITKVYFLSYACHKASSYFIHYFASLNSLNIDKYASSPVNDRLLYHHRNSCLHAKSFSCFDDLILANMQWFFSSRIFNKIPKSYPNHPLMLSWQPTPSSPKSNSSCGRGNALNTVSFIMSRFGLDLGIIWNNQFNSQDFNYHEEQSI